MASLRSVRRYCSPLPKEESRHPNRNDHNSEHEELSHSLTSERTLSILLGDEESLQRRYLIVHDVVHVTLSNLRHGKLFVFLNDGFRLPASDMPDHSYCATGSMLPSLLARGSTIQETWKMFTLPWLQ